MMVLADQGSEEIHLGAGDDWVNGFLQRDRVWGGAGNDFIRGGEGPDILYGEAGNDELVGLEGDDALYGGDGRDVIKCGDGNATWRNPMTPTRRGRLRGRRRVEPPRRQVMTPTSSGARPGNICARLPLIAGNRCDMTSHSTLR